MQSTLEDFITSVTLFVFWGFVIITVLELIERPSSPIVTRACSCCSRFLLVQWSVFMLL